MNYIGIDGGGTKTKLALFDENGIRIDGLVVDTCHYSRVSYEQMGEILSKAVLMLMKKNNINKKDLVISIGLAGYGNVSTINVEIDKVIKKVFGDFADLYINSDAHIAVYGALGGQDGVVLISGTGSIAMSIQNEHIRRCGGWGPVVGDEGSGYKIGLKALSFYSKQVDGREKKSILYQEIKNQYKLISDYDIIQVFKNPDRKEIASLSKLVYRSAQKGDKNALQIFDEAGNELAKCANNLALHFEDQVILTYCGSVFNAGEFIFSPLKNYLNKNIVLKEPVFSPEEGAYLIAKNNKRISLAN